MNDFEDTLSTRLHERVAHEAPDLAALVEGSVRTGVRMRRRRRIGVATAAVAGVAMIGGVGALVTTGGGTETDPGFAQEPTTSATPTPEQVRPTGIGPVEDYFATLNLSYSVDENKKLLQVSASDVAPADREQISALLPVGWEVEYLDPAAPAVGLVDTVPVTVPKGWTCEWYLVDDKASCESGDGGNASLNIRPAADHAQWSTSPDKGGAGSGTYVTEVHGEIFVSVQPGLGTSDAELRSLRDGLRWTD